MLKCRIRDALGMLKWRFKDSVVTLRDSEATFKGPSRYDFLRLRDFQVTFCDV